MRKLFKTLLIAQTLTTFFSHATILESDYPDMLEKKAEGYYSEAFSESGEGWGWHPTRPEAARSMAKRDCFDNSNREDSCHAYPAILGTWDIFSDAIDERNLRQKEVAKDK